MSDEFSEIDLSDNAVPTGSFESTPNLRTRRKNFHLPTKHTSISPSPASQINPSLYLNTSMHEKASPPPPLSLFDSSNS
ncbi:unnamed protein product, partial [Rotaria magnacalcarata]